MPSFNLLTQPWIPVHDRGGGRGEVGILEVLTRAHGLTEIRDPAPPIQIGLYRLLVAFVQDALALRELEDLEGVLKAGRFDSDRLRAYVDRVGSGRFDLFDPTHPFLQTPPLPRLAEKTQPVAYLFQHLPTGTNVIHFHHATETVHAFSPAACARGLASIAPFTTAGGRGKSPSVNGSPPWYVLQRGTTLFATLVLNCCALPVPGLDWRRPVAWQANKAVLPNQKAGCSSLLEGLTWRPRRIRLIPGEGGTCTYTGTPSPVLVREMIYNSGLMYTGGWTDPQVAYRETEKGRVPLRPEEDRELWRDTGPLLLLRKGDYVTEDRTVRYSRPLVVEQFRILRREFDGLPSDTPEGVEVYGIRTDKRMKVFEWRFERLSLPRSVAENSRAGAQLQQALDLAERVAGALRAGLRKAYPRDGQGNPNAFESLITAARRSFWGVLRRSFEAEFLPALADQPLDDLDAEGRLADTWREILRKVATMEFDRAVAPLDADADAIRRQVAARQFFLDRLHATLTPAGSATGKAQSRKRRRS